MLFEIERYFTRSTFKISSAQGGFYKYISAVRGTQNLFSNYSMNAPTTQCAHPITCI